MERIFLLKGLDCPNCSAKIEKEVGDLENVNSSSVNLMKQTLTIQTETFDNSIVEQIETIVHSHEPDVEVSEQKADTSVAPDKKEKTPVYSDDDKKLTIRLISGAVIYAVGMGLTLFGHVSLPVELGVLIVAYIILGWDVVWQAVKNITRGQIFDEHFLMSLSTIGAFAIGEYPEAVAVMLFYQVGEFFQSLAVKRSRKSISDLMDIRPDSATVRRNGELVVVAPETVSIGELIVVKPGEKIPLDGIVTEGESMLDTRALTGESVPRIIRKGEEALSGCVNQSGVLTIKVTKSFGESTVTKIIDLVENASSRKAPTENFITTFARYYTPIVVGMAAILAIIPPVILGGGWSEWLRRGFCILNNYHVCIRLFPYAIDKFFDFIGDMRDHLNSRAQIFSPSFLIQHIPIDFSCRQIGIFIQVFINKSLIMSQIQICLRAVFRDKHLSMLIRAHSSRIYINIRI